MNGSESSAVPGSWISVRGRPNCNDGAMSNRIAFLGCGSMNEAILGGLLEAGTDPADIVATVRRAERAAELAERHHGITAIAGEEEPENNKQAAKGSGVVILGVKPVGIADLAREISGSLPRTRSWSASPRRCPSPSSRRTPGRPAGHPDHAQYAGQAGPGRGVRLAGHQLHPEQLQRSRTSSRARGPWWRCPRNRWTRCRRSAAPARPTPSTWPRRWPRQAGNWAWIRNCRCCWPGKPWRGRLHAG